MSAMSESVGTLDAAASVVVNGPRGLPEDWDQVDWTSAEAGVRRLRQRIFTASMAGEHRKVRSLQRLMLRVGRTRCSARAGLPRSTRGDGQQASMA